MVAGAFDIVEDFITEDERLEYVDWFDNSFMTNQNLFIGVENHNGPKLARYTSRLTKEGAVYPDVAYRVKQRIIDHYSPLVGIEDVDDNGYTKDSMIAVAHLPGSDTYKHIDPDNRITFNIIIQSPECGGRLSVLGIPRITPERALHAYPAGRYHHKVSRVEGNRRRYLWIYRFMVDHKEWCNYSMYGGAK